MEFHCVQLHLLWNRYVNTTMPEQRSRILTKFLQGFYLAVHLKKLDINDLGFSSDFQSMHNLLVRDLLSDIHHCCIIPAFNNAPENDSSNVAFELDTKTDTSQTQKDTDDTGKVRHYLQKGRGWLLLFTLLHIDGGGRSNGNISKHAEKDSGQASVSSDRDLASVLASLLRILRTQDIKQEETVDCLGLVAESVDVSYVQTKLPLLTAGGTIEDLDTTKENPRLELHHKSRISSSRKNAPITNISTRRTSIQKHRRMRSVQNEPPSTASPDSDSESENDNVIKSGSYRSNSANGSTRTPQTVPFRSSRVGESSHFHHKPAPQLGFINSAKNNSDLSKTSNNASTKRPSILYDVHLLSDDDIDSLFTDFGTCLPSSRLEDDTEDDIMSGHENHKATTATDKRKMSSHRISEIACLGQWDVMTLLVKLLGCLCHSQNALARDVLPTLLDMLREREVPESQAEWSFLRHALATLCRVCQLLIKHSHGDKGATVISGHRTSMHLFQVARYFQEQWIKLDDKSKNSNDMVNKKCEIYEFISEIIRVSLYNLAVHFYHLHTSQVLPSTIMKPLSLWHENGGSSLCEWLIQFGTSCDVNAKESSECHISASGTHPNHRHHKSIIDLIGLVIICLKTAKCFHKHREKCIRRSHRHCSINVWFCHHSDSLLVNIHSVDDDSLSDDTTASSSSGSKCCGVACLIGVLMRTIQQPQKEHSANWELAVARVVQVLSQCRSCCCLPAAKCASILMKSLHSLTNHARGLQCRILRLVNSMLLQEMASSPDRVPCPHCCPRSVGDFSTTECVPTTLHNAVEVLLLYQSIILFGERRLSGVALRHLLVLVKLSDDWLKMEIVNSIVLPILLRTQKEIQTNQQSEDTDMNVFLDHLIGLSKYFLCLMCYLPCSLNVEWSIVENVHINTMELIVWMAKSSHFRRYVYKLVENVILARPQSAPRKVSSGQQPSKRRILHMYSVASPSQVDTLTSFLLSVVNFKECIAATPDFTLKLIDNLQRNTDIWSTYETLFVRSSRFRIAFVDCNGSDTAYLLVKEVILRVSKLSAYETSGESDETTNNVTSKEDLSNQMASLFKLLECLLVLVMEGSRTRNEFFYSGYSCEVIYNQLESLILSNFPENIDTGGLLLQSLLNTCGRRGYTTTAYCNTSIHTTGPIDGYQPTEHIEKMLHALSNKFENASDEEMLGDEELRAKTAPVNKHLLVTSAGLVNDTSDDPNLNRYGYYGDVDSDSTPTIFSTPEDDRVEMRGDPETPVHTGLLRLVARVTLSLPPKRFHHLQRRILTDLLPIMKIAMVTRVSVPEMTMLPTIMEKQAEILLTNEPELANLRSSALNLTRVMAINKLSVSHMATLLGVVRQKPVCLPELLDVLTDVARTIQPSPLSSFEYPFTVPDAIEVREDSEPLVAALQCRLGRESHHHSRGFSVTFWIMVDSRKLVSDKKYPSFSEDKKKKAKTKPGTNLLSHFRQSSQSSSPHQFSPHQSSRTAESEKNLLLTADQVTNNLLHIFSLDSMFSNRDVGMQHIAGGQSFGTPNSSTQDPEIPSIRFQMWCEPASGTVYFRLLQSQSSSNKSSPRFKHSIPPTVPRTAPPGTLGFGPTVFGPASGSRGPMGGKSCLLAVSDTGLRAVLPLKRWSHVCVTVTPYKTSTLIQVLINGGNLQELTLYHGSMPDTCPVALSLGHQSFKEFNSISKIYQLGNFSLYKEPLPLEDSALLLYCLGPDYLSFPVSPGGGVETCTGSSCINPLHVRTIQAMLNKLLVPKTSPDDADTARILSLLSGDNSFSALLPMWSSKLLHIKRCLLAIYSPQTPSEFLIFPNTASTSVGSSLESSFFLTDWMKKRSVQDQSGEANSSPIDPVWPSRDWGALRKVDLLDKGISKIQAFSRMTLDESLLPLGGVRVLLYLMAMVVGEYDSGYVQIKVLDLFLTSLKRSFTLTQELHDIGGYQLISKLVRNPKFHFTDDALALFLNNCSSRPLVQRHGTSWRTIVPCGAFCTDVYLLKDLLLTWPVWNRLTTSQGVLLLDAILLFVADHNPWLPVNTHLFQDVLIVETLLFACQEVLQESGSLPGEEFCCRLVSLIEACVGAPPQVRELVTICEALLLLHPPANTYVTFEEKNFYHQLKPFMEEQGKSGSPFAFSSDITRLYSDSSSSQDADKEERFSMAKSSKGFGDMSSLRDIPDLGEKENVVIKRFNNSDTELSRTLPSHVETQVLRRFFDLTNQAGSSGTLRDSEERRSSDDSDIDNPQDSSDDRGIGESGTDSLLETSLKILPTSSYHSPSPRQTAPQLSSDKEQLASTEIKSSTTSPKMLAEDPGAVALTCGLLSLLTDILRVKLPDSMVPQVIGTALKPDLLLTLAMSPNYKIREKVVSTFYSYLSLIHYLPNQVAHLREHNTCLLLANQLHQFPATRDLVQTAFACVIGREHIITIDMDAPQSEDMLVSVEADPVLSHEETPLALGWGVDIGFKWSLPLVLALIERTAEDGVLCQKTLTGMTRLLKSVPQLINLALDVGLYESLLNLISSLNRRHQMLDCPCYDSVYWTTVAHLEPLIALIIDHLFVSPDPRHFIMCIDYIRLLHAFEENEIVKYGTRACASETSRHILCHCLRSTLDNIGDASQRPLMDLLPTERHLKSRTSITLLSPLPELNENRQESMMKIASIVSGSDYNSSSENISGSMTQRDNSTKDIAMRFKRIVTTVTDFLLHGKSLKGPLTTQKHLDHIFKESVFEFFFKAIVKCATNTKKEVWNSLLWSIKDVLRVQFVRIIVHLTLVGHGDTEFTICASVVNTLSAEPKIAKIMEFCFASLHAAAYQLASNLTDICLQASCHQESNIPGVKVSAIKLLTILRRHRLIRSDSGGLVTYFTSKPVAFPVDDDKMLLTEMQKRFSIYSEEERNGWHREESLKKQHWEQRMADTVEAWKSRCSTSSNAVTTDAVEVTKLVVNCQNAIRKRFIEAIKQIHADTVQVKRQWGHIVHSLTHEKGVWHDSDSYPSFWQLDPTEGPSRVRKRLSRCYLNMEPHFITPDHRHKLNNTLSKQSIFFLFSDEASSMDAAATLYRLSTTDKISLTTRCFLVGLSLTRQGELLIGETAVYFVGDEGDSNYHQQTVGCDENTTFTWTFKEIKEIHKRRFELRDIALEIFLTNGQTALLAMESTKDRDIVFSNVDSLPLPNRLLPRPLHEVQTLWLGGHITNFEYLTHLNSASGRTYNDLMQYPIFPFILKDYVSEILDLCSPSTFRNLSKPIAVQFAEEEIRRKFQEKQMHYRENSCDMYSTVPPYHYSSHYSNSATVLHYLIRLPPFTYKFIHFQDSSFDVPDRAFHTLSSCYTLSTTSSSCVKEIIPEFFYLPEFLDNSEGFDLGIRQCGTRVDHVALPPWCQNDPRLFTLIHRAALESVHVTENINAWIDLIFGFKQIGKPAVEALNLFHPYTYFDAINPDKIEDRVRRRAVEDMIRNYGQTPKQLFVKRPHAYRRLAATSSPPLPGSLNPGKRKEVVSLMLLGLPSGYPSTPPVAQERLGGPLTSVRGLVWGSWVGSPDMPEVSLTWRQRYSQLIGHMQSLPEASTGLSSSFPSSGDSPLPPIPSQELPVLACERGSSLIRLVHPDGSVCILKVGLHPAENALVAALVESDLSPQLSVPRGPVALVRLDPRWKVRVLVIGQQGRRICIGLETGLVVVFTFNFIWDKNRFPLVVDEDPHLLFGHTCPIWVISLCESYSLLATADSTGNVLLWDANKLRLVRQIVWPSTHQDHVREAVLTPSYIGEQGLAGVTAMAFSETLGDLAIARRFNQGRGCQVTVFTVNGRHVASQSITTNTVHSMTYSSLPEGCNINVLVLGMGSGRIRFLDSWTLGYINRLQVEQEKESPIVCVSFATGARRLYASSSDGWVNLVESGTGSTKTGPHSKHLIACLDWP